MSFAEALAWILAMVPVRDAHHWPFHRPERAAKDFVTVALEHADTVDPRVSIAYLDVLAANESSYRTSAAGDCPGMRPGDSRCTRDLGAKSCGAFQTPCSRTPTDGLGQTRLAWTILFEESVKLCPEHVLWAYTSGHCARSAVADRYEAEVRAELAVPLEVVTGVTP